MKLGNVGMVKMCQDLALVAEPAQDQIGVHAALDELNSHLTLILIVISHGQINCSHAAAADFAKNLVSPDTISFDGLTILRFEHLGGE